MRRWRWVLMLVGSGLPLFLQADEQTLFSFVRPLDVVQVSTEDAWFPELTAETTPEGAILRRLSFNNAAQPTLSLSTVPDPLEVGDAQEGGEPPREDMAFDERPNGRSFGMELIVRRPFTNELSGTLAYTLSRSTRRLGGTDVPSRKPTRAPETETERAIAVLWRDVLKIPEVGAEEDFFALGGDSLRAATLLRRVEEAWGRELPLEDFADGLTVAGMARVLEESGEPPA